MRYGINGLVIDPYNELDHHRPPGMSETEYVSQMLGRLKRFGLLTDCHVFFVAHPAKPERNQGVNGQIGGAEPVLDQRIRPLGQQSRMLGLWCTVHGTMTAPSSLTTEIHVKKARRRAIGAPGVRTLIYDPIAGRYS